jgi:RimJ/RimL family protein N-acetyltransferase
MDRSQKAFRTLGMGRFAIERPADGAFLGACGLMPGIATLPIAPYIDIGWRLNRAAWGSGYASEAAAAVLDDGFGRLGLSEICAITASINHRSRAVMERIGMDRDATSDFDLASVAEGDPMRPTVVYRKRA